MACSTCGLIAFAKAMIGGPATQSVRDSRIESCRRCKATEPDGKTRLFRELQGTKYCGMPRPSKFIRDEKTQGCGCNLDLKVRFAKSSCPVGNWGVVDSTTKASGTAIFSGVSNETGICIPEAIAIRSYQQSHPDEKIYYVVSRNVAPWVGPLHTGIEIIDAEKAAGMAYEKLFDLSATQPRNGMVADLLTALSVPRLGSPIEIQSGPPTKAFDIHGAVILSLSGAAWDPFNVLGLERYFLANGHKVLLHDSSERTGCVSPNISRIPPDQLYKLIMQSGLVISGALGIAHFAAVLGTPAIAVYPQGDCENLFDYTDKVATIGFTSQSLIKGMELFSAQKYGISKFFSKA